MHNTPETRDQPHRASIRETPLAICVPNSVSPLSVFFFFQLVHTTSWAQSWGLRVHREVVSHGRMSHRQQELSQAT